VVRNGGPSAVAGARVTISAGVSTGSGHNAAGGGSSSGSSGHLASTGISDLNRNLGVAGVCLLIGGGLLFLGRRRHLARHRPVA
jgi:LPXTG-motif cell wall-anchored protein